LYHIELNCPEIGKCKNGKGLDGFNKRSPVEVYRTKDGECTNLIGKDFSSPSGQCVYDINTNLVRAHLEGAKIHEETDVFYSGISASYVDSFTEIGGLLGWRSVNVSHLRIGPYYSHFNGVNEQAVKNDYLRLGRDGYGCSLFPSEE